MRAQHALAEAYERLAAMDDPAAVITLVPKEVAMAKAAAADSRLPLYGMTFAVKDNIDVAGVPTTAACAAFAYTPSRSATVVERLEAAGAVAVAKTNMDQFATGLVGTRSPYGTPRNLFDPTRVPGGSSSGSAVVVASGAVSFALGTDTAGSGRVPAAYGGIVGAKPTRGWLSTRGVVPAVRSIDCVSVFARSVPDAWRVLELAGGFDPTDPFSRRPGQLPIGARVDDNPDLTRFRAAGRLLYDGPFVAERFAAVGKFVASCDGDLDPTVKAIIEASAAWTAADMAAAGYELAELAREVERIWDDHDAIVIPTAPPAPTLDEVAADPVAVNASLGVYTTFTNLLDLCAVAVPTGVTDGLPTSVQVVGPAWADATVAAIADRIHLDSGGLQGTTAQRRRGDPWVPADRAGVDLAVVGAHLHGQPLHHQLTDLDARWVSDTRTAPCYRLYALATRPPKPGLVRVQDGGAPIAVEVYRLTHEAFGRFVAAIPSPMCIGSVHLESGTAAGFLCEPAAIEGAEDITRFGGWRAYLKA